MTIEHLLDELTGGPDINVAFCPITNCPWHIDVTLPDVPATALANVMSAETIARYREWIDAEIGMHLAGHDMVEFVATIVQLQKDLYDATEGD